MPESYRRQSALAALGLAAKARAAAAGAGVTLRERGPRAQLCLRGRPEPPFTGAVRKVLGVAPPLEAGATAVHGDRTLFWLGPDEWLAVFGEGERKRVIADLRKALAPRHAALVDQSHARAILSVAGPRARLVLQKGCPLDLHPSRFRAGACAQSKFARCQVLLHQSDDAPAYDLYVPRSFARYLWAWLEDAAAEYGLAIEAGGG